MLNSQLKAPLQSQGAANKRAFPSGFFECCSYKNSEGNSVCFPAFCPQALICTNAIVGKVCTKINKEEEICLEMGPTGICVCAAMIPLGIYTPSGGAGIYCCLTNYLRRRTMEEFNIEEESVLCAGPSSPPCVNFVVHGICYPCSVFQLYVAHKELAAKK
eukprot:gene28260-34126_t